VQKNPVTIFSRENGYGNGLFEFSQNICLEYSHPAQTGDRKTTSRGILTAPHGWRLSKIKICMHTDLGVFPNLVKFRYNVSILEAVFSINREVDEELV